MLTDFKATRDAYLEKRKELLTELKTASETRAKEILDALRNESKEREEEERSLGKQIREQLKELREKRKGGE